MNEDMRWENICPDCKQHRRNCDCDKSIGDPLPDDRTDALRYRWLRRFDHFSQVNSMLDLIEYSTLDSAVDAAMDMERQITESNK